MIGSALVGTFLGVLLAYGIVNPFANRCKQVIEEDGAIYHVVKQIIVASLHGHPQPLVIEAARSSLSHANQPAFAEVFDGMRGKRSEEHTSELQSLMRNPYAVYCLKKKNKKATKQSMKITR